MKLSLYVILHYIGTNKQAITLHIKWGLDPECFILTVGLLIRLMALLLLPLDVRVQLWVLVITSY
jgi:hypothetical protein